MISNTVEGNVIRFVKDDESIVEVDTQAVAASLTRPWDREEARTTMEGLFPERYTLMILEMAPIFRGGFVEKWDYPPRTYLETGPSLSSGDWVNVYAAHREYQGATFGNLTYVDLVDCNCDGAIFKGELQYVQAHGTTFFGATLPTVCPPDVYGMVEEAFRQGFQRLSTEDRTRVWPVFRDVVAWVDGTTDSQKYLHSWTDVTEKIVRKYGLPKMQDMMYAVLAPWPNLIKHWNSVVAQLRFEGRI